MQVSGRTILVTGASSGIGRELALAFAGLECELVLSGRDPDRLGAVARATGGRAVEADLSTHEGVLQLVREVRRLAPRLSLVFNNAAVQRNYLLAELEEDDALREIAAELQADLGAPMQIAALLLPVLRTEAARSGQPSAVINLTSGLALSPKKTAAVYSAAKAGLRTFTKALRFQLQAGKQAGAPDVRAVEVMLPMVDTPMTAGRGRAKMPPAVVANEIIEGLKQDREEIYVGKARALPLLHRLVPSLAEQMFRNA